MSNKNTLDDAMMAVAKMVDDEGLLVHYMDSQAHWHTAMRLAGQVRGRSIAGCLCEFLDAQHICMRDRDCPSAYRAHVLIADPISKELARRNRREKDWNTSQTYRKLCPVLLNEIIHEYTLDDINGGII